MEVNQEVLVESEKVNEENSVQEQSNKEDRGIDLDRVHVKNIPSFIGFKQFKKQLEKILGSLKTKKVRHMSDYAYVTFESPEDAQTAIKLIDGYEIKKFTLTAQLAATEVKNYRAAVAEDAETVVQKTARESVTPLAEEPYEKQLEIKQESCSKLIDTLYQQLRNNKVDGIGKQGEFRKRLQTVLPSPNTSEYRNKCEFTIGHDLNGDICVGFVGGRFAKNQHHVLPPNGVDIVSTQMHAIVKDVHDFVRESGLESFNEFERKGFWKMLTIREFGGDVMLIFTVFPMEATENDRDPEEDIKKRVVERFLNSSTLTEKRFRISSIYWQRTVHCSDAPNFELIGGTPYIYESLLDCRFRVSPPAFFQTNSQAAAVLYSTIGELCGLGVENAQPAIKPEVKEEADEEIPAKKVKLEEKVDEVKEDVPMEGVKVEENVKSEVETEEKKEDPGTVLLDICCGTGTIGQCLLKNVHNKQKICCIGIEMIPEAVEDAKQNSKQNKMEKCCKYIAGKAEDTFRSMRYHLPTGFDLRYSRVVGVLDPPRAGMHEKVILACREMETMKRLVFVSCEPKAAMKNIVDLCRPTSRKFGGVPFSVSKVQPVDIFPQTNHFEWIIQLDR